MTVRNGSSSLSDLQSKWLGCGITFRTPSIIGHSISAVTRSLLSTLGPHVEQWYARLCRALELERPFLSEVIVTNAKLSYSNMFSDEGHQTSDGGSHIAMREDLFTFT